MLMHKPGNLPVIKGTGMKNSGLRGINRTDEYVNYGILVFDAFCLISEGFFIL